MASEKQIAANRRNARLSTGPRSDAGKARVRLNALTHGLTAATVVLPGEDAAALQARVDAWKDDLRPGGALEDYLVERAAHVAWQLDRADRTIAARLTERMRQQPIDRDQVEAEAAADLGRRLFRDPRGPLGLYPHWSDPDPHPRMSEPDDPLDAAGIVLRLEATAAGCRWLLDRWAGLRAILEAGRTWQSPDRFKAVRLLGRQPLEALDDERVTAIYLACWAMDPEGPWAFDDVGQEMDQAEAEAFDRRAEGRQVERRIPADPAAGRAALVALVEEATAGLEARLAVHREHRDAERAAAPRAGAFDDSDAGERLRRYQVASARALSRTIEVLLKVRREADRDCGHQPEPIAEGPTPPEPAAPAIEPSTPPFPAAVPTAPPSGAGSGTPPAPTSFIPQPPSLIPESESPRPAVDETKPSAPDRPTAPPGPRASSRVPETAPSPRQSPREASSRTTPGRNHGDAPGPAADLGSPCRSVLPYHNSVKDRG